MKTRKAIILLTGLALLFLYPAVSLADKAAGKVLVVKKDVYRIRDNSRETAKPRMDLAMKDAVETAEKSRTKLFFTDDSILNLGELSRVEVEEYIYSPEKQRSKSVYRLIDGSLKVVVGRSDLEVHTASAVAAARGTKFIMWSKRIEDKKGGKRQTCVMTLEGKVEFRLKDEAITAKTKRKKVIVNEGTVSCIESAADVKNIEGVMPITSKMRAEWTDDFPVLASDITPDADTPPAFAPPPVVTFEVPDVPPVDQQPVMNVIPVIEKQGDFERID